tara:strand:- start:80 stop:454 length:375 start_codon:yes stop_codon:yes gene_type:complete
MKIFYLGFLLFLFPDAKAEWTEIGENKLGTKYLDFIRIRKFEGYTFYWEMLSFYKATNKGFMSVKSNYKLDCIKFRYKKISSLFYEKPMAKGKPMFYKNYNISNWKYPLSNSPKAFLKKKICEY